MQAVGADPERQHAGRIRALHPRRPGEVGEADARGGHQAGVALSSISRHPEARTARVSLRDMRAEPRDSWRELLAEPGEDGHIVQLYQDDDFYGEAISHFAAEGLVRGESIILVATRPHWENISGRLHGKGFDTDGAVPPGPAHPARRRRHAAEVHGRQHARRRRSSSRSRSETIARARAGGKYPRVRWWGEMVNVLYVNGNPARLQPPRAVLRRGGARGAHRDLLLVPDGQVRSRRSTTWRSATSAARTAT